MDSLKVHKLIHRDRYPIDDVSSVSCRRTIAQVRKELDEDGCAVVKGFLSSEGLKLLRAEAVDRLPQTHYSKKKKCNVYLGDSNPARPSDHPQNTFLERTNGFVTADTFGEESLSRQLYYWPPLKEFLRRCLNKRALYIYEDPVSNMIVNVARRGQNFNWHFDTNEFTITMLLQAAEQGGVFEYVPNLRQKRDERYSAVKRVLDGDRSAVKPLELNPGDLQLFLGRYSLHQVTPNEGATERLLLIMSFAETPNMVGSRVRVQDLYGKVAEVHMSKEKDLTRADQLLD
ncbi:MAG: hypothetical protein AAF438_20925 [Pseudomonadota bacterium]